MVCAHCSTVIVRKQEGFGGDTSKELFLDWARLVLSRLIEFFG